MKMRLNDLEEKYPDLPPAVLLKADLLFAGIRPDAGLLAAGEGANPHFRPLSVDGKSGNIPYFMLLPFDLGKSPEPAHELLVLVRPDEKSPYRLVPDEQGGFMLQDDTQNVSPTRPQPEPAWYAWARKNQHERARLGVSQHGDMLIPNLTPACEYWPREGEEDTCRCLFCGYGAVSERSRGLGQERGVASPSVDAMREFAAILPHAAKEVKHIYLVGGSMRNRDLEAERYLQLTRAAVKAAPDTRGRIGCGSQALDRAWLQQIKDAGAGYVCFNLEVWDPDMWQILCPGKARFIGRDTWLQNMCDAVEIFGRGAVLSAFVAGVETVKPVGFATDDQAIRSALEGTEWMLARGMSPIFSPFSPAISSRYDQASGPNLDYFLRLNRETARLRQKYSSPLDTRFVCHGCTYAQLECDLDLPG